MLSQSSLSQQGRPSIPSIKERGSVNEITGQVKARCSVIYLHTLYVELSRARSFVLVSIPTTPNVHKQMTRLQFLKHEFSRLFKNPSLYPSAAAQARFMVLCFRLDCEYQFSATTHKLLFEKEIQNITRISDKYLVKPTYRKGSEGWDHFLSPATDESVLFKNPAEPTSTLQIIPAIGARICSDLASDERRVLQHAIRTGARPDKPYAPGPPLRFKTREIIDPLNPLHPSKLEPCSGAMDRICMHAENAILSPSPYRKDLALRCDTRDTKSDSFENVSSMIHRADWNTPGPGIHAIAMNAPNAFMVTGIRSWHRPQREWDSPQA